MVGTPLLARLRLVAALVAAAAAGIVVLGLRYAGGASAGRLDRAVDRRLRAHLGTHRFTLRNLITFADPKTVVVVCAVMCVLFLLAGRRRLALLAVLGPAIAGAGADYVLKPAIGRHLGNQLSFPSGHTTASVSIAIVIVISLLGPTRPRWPAAVRWPLAALALLGAAAIATALVGAGYHYATDTVGGLCLAVAVVPSVAYGIDRLADAWTDRTSRRGRQGRTDGTAGSGPSGAEADAAISVPTVDR
jgi:undecaprenyl-diphosphatase